MIAPRLRESIYRQRAFSMVEMVGVIAILAVLSSVIVPPMVQRLSRVSGQKEDQMLAVLGDGFVRYVRAYQTIPGSASWVTNVAAMTGLSLNEVSRVVPWDANTARAFVIHPSFSPTNSSGTNPLWTQTTHGAFTVTNSRIMIISVGRTNLPSLISSGRASSASTFDTFWNWNYDPTTKAPPAGSPAIWTGNGEYLHIQRINLTPEFQRITFNNMISSGSGPNYKIGTGAITSMTGVSSTDLQFLNGTLISVYKTNATTLDLEYSLQATVNFVFETNNQWRIP